MANHEPDFTLDQRLGEVAVPPDLLGRLRDIAALSDDELDVRLRDVAVPDGLLTHLRAVLDDEELDELLREVPPSAVVVPRSRVIPYERSRSLVGRLAVAAALMLAVGVGYVTSLAGLLVVIHPPERPPVSLLVIDRGPLEFVSPVEQGVAIVPSPPSTFAGAPPLRWGEDEADPQLLTFLDHLPPGPAGQLFAEIPEQWNPWDNWLLRRWGVRGYTRQEERAPLELAAVAPLAARGLDAPLARGLDREFLYSRGVSPPVLVAADSSANAVSPPLTANTAGVEYARRCLAEGRWPPADAVRVEDFLAALDSRSAAAEPGTLAIRTAAGPSVFSPSSSSLIQVAVKAGRSERRQLPATHLTIALDVSNAMNWNGRLELVRLALRRFLPHLEPRDRLSLIVFGDEVAEVVREAEPDDARQVADLLDRLNGAGGADLGGGLQQALSTSLETEADAQLARRLVLITAHRPAFNRDTAEGLRHLFAEAATTDFRFQVLDVGESDDTSDSNRDWADVAGAAFSSCQPIRAAEPMRWSLVEALTGTATLAATQTKLRVEFNPAAVAAYRLLGHEATAYGGLLPASVESDMHVDEEQGVLFEVWLYPNDVDDVATVRLDWTDAVTGQSRQAGPQRVSRLQFATSFEGSALSLQAAAIAAETAEILRQGYNFAVVGPPVYRYQPKPRSFGEVQAVVRRAQSGLIQGFEFQRMVELIDSASRIGGGVPPGPGRSGTRGLVAGWWRESRE